VDRPSEVRPCEFPRGDGGGATPITTALGAYLEQMADGDGRTWNDRLVESTVGKAVNGDVKTIQMIWTRVEGSKPVGVVGPPALEISDELARKILMATQDDDDDPPTY
jgi:hypothetical protein